VTLRNFLVIHKYWGRDKETGGHITKQKWWIFIKDAGKQTRSRILFIYSFFMTATNIKP